MYLGMGIVAGCNVFPFKFLSPRLLFSYGYFAGPRDFSCNFAVIIHSKRRPPEKPLVPFCTPTGNTIVRAAADHQPRFAALHNKPDAAGANIPVSATLEGRPPDIAAVAIRLTQHVGRRVPPPGRADDVLERGVGLPAKNFTRLFVVGNERRRVAFAAIDIIDGEAPP